MSRPPNRSKKAGDNSPLSSFDVHCSKFGVRCSSSLSPFLKSHLLEAHKILIPSLRDLSIALVNDKKMSDLHMQFMNIPGPTDVLTFPLDLDKKGRVITGEVVICVPEARRRCREHGTTLPQELLLYALHGMLHLCGFDDRTDREFERMHRTEDDILARIGVGRVFRPASARRSARAVPGDD